MIASLSPRTFALLRTLATKLEELIQVAGQDGAYSIQIVAKFAKHRDEPRRVISSIQWEDDEHSQSR